MTRQKSENPIVPEDPRKLVPTCAPHRGGKGIPVSQQETQLRLFFATADKPDGQPSELDNTMVTGEPETVVAERPKAKRQEEKVKPATMQRVGSKGQLRLPCGDNERSQTGRQRG